MKLIKIFMSLAIANVAVISSDAQERGRRDRESGERNGDRKLLSKTEVTNKYDQNGDGTLDYREKMSFLRSLNEDQREAYRKAFFQNNQNRGTQEGNRDADWAREAIERFRGSGSRGNPLDPEAIKRRFDYAVKEGLMTREQAEKMMAAAKKRMEVDQRGGDNRRDLGASNNARGSSRQQRGGDRGGNNTRGHESQSNDRQDQARTGYETRRKRIEEGVRSGKIKREDAAKMLEDLRKRMAAASRGGDNNARTNQQRGGDRGGADMEAMRKRIEAGVKSGKIKREDAGKILEGLRKRMEAANRGDDDKKEEGKQDPRIARYRATEKEIAAAMKAGKISKEDAEKKLVAVRKQLWSDNTSRSSQSKNSSRSRSSSSPSSRSSQSKKPQPKGKGQDRTSTNRREAAKRGGDDRKKEGIEDRVHHLHEAIKHLKAAGRSDLAEEVEKRVHESHQKRETGNQRGDHGRDERSNRGEAMRKAIEERMKQAREAREKAERDSRGRGNDRGEDIRKAWEERMKKAREDRERAERSSRGRGNDRGEDMRKAWEERIKQWREARERSERDSRGHGNDRGREMRERDGGRDGRRPEAQRGPQRGRGPQDRGPQTQHGPQRGRGPQLGGSWRGGPQGRGPERGGGPRGR